MFPKLVFTQCHFERKGDLVTCRAVKITLDLNVSLCLELNVELLQD